MVTVLGIDVAKDSLGVALLGPSSPRKRSFPNTPAGHQELLNWLSKQHLNEIQACLEATGSYADAIAEALHDAGYWVSMVNPARIAASAQSRLAHTKTDPADAVLIAQFAQSEQPARWTPPAPELRELRALVRHLDALHSQRQAERNRQAAGPHPSAVASALVAHLSFLAQHIASVQQAISAHIDRHPNLKRDRALLTSIKGIGERTATRLLAESGDRRR
jgi:transposase